MTCEFVLSLQTAAELVRDLLMSLLQVALVMPHALPFIGILLVLLASPRDIADSASTWPTASSQSSRVCYQENISS